MKKKKAKTTLDVIEKGFGKVTLVNILLCVLFLILGIVIYANPDVTIDIAGVILGVYLIVVGILKMADYFARKYDFFYRYHLIIGILAVILGIFTIINPFKISVILTFVLGIYLIITSIAKIFESFKLKKYHYDGWLLILVTAIILLIFGIFIVIYSKSSLVLTEIAGIFMILASILEACDQIMMYRNAKQIVKIFKGD